MKRTKLAALLLTIALLLSLTACGEAKAPEATPDAGAPTEDDAAHSDAPSPARP